MCSIDSTFFCRNAKKTQQNPCIFFLLVVLLGTLLTHWGSGSFVEIFNSLICLRKASSSMIRGGMVQYPNTCTNLLLLLTQLPYIKAWYLSSISPMNLANMVTAFCGPYMCQKQSKHIKAILPHIFLVIKQIIPHFHKKLKNSKWASCTCTFLKPHKFRIR